MSARSPQFSGAIDTRLGPFHFFTIGTPTGHASHPPGKHARFEPAACEEGGHPKSSLRTADGPPNADNSAGCTLDEQNPHPRYRPTYSGQVKIAPRLPPAA